MNEIKHLHRQAMEQCDLAIVARMNGNEQISMNHTNAAYELESQAANALLYQFSAEPTRSVLFRSAATLARDCGKFYAAHNLEKSIRTTRMTILDEAKTFLATALTDAETAAKDTETAMADPVIAAFAKIVEKSVSDYLAAHGIAADQVETVGADLLRLLNDLAGQAAAAPAVQAVFKQAAAADVSHVDAPPTITDQEHLGAALEYEKHQNDGHLYAIRHAIDWVLGKRADG